MEKPTRDTQIPQIGRLKASWRVLRGEALTPPQVLAQWIEYQIVFDGILDKLSVSLARLAKRDIRELKKNLEVLTDGQTHKAEEARPTTIKERKAALRRRAFGGFANRPEAAVSEKEA